MYTGIAATIYRTAAALLRGRFAAENVHFAVVFKKKKIYTPLPPLLFVYLFAGFFVLFCVLFLFVVFLVSSKHWT